MTKPQPHPLQKVLENRIAIIDGAMGTTIRTYGMTEAHIRGQCPAGGMHDNTVGNNFLVAMSSSGVAGQSNWRWCNKCQALSFAGSATLGNCSAGGQHDHTGSGNHVLAQTAGGTLPDDTQNNWRWCKKCQVLAFAGSPSTACAAGGIHDYSASGNYP